MHPVHQQIHDAIHSAIDHLSEEQMRFHPEGKWDSAAILEHLAMTFSGTARVMNKCLREGRPLATSPTWIHRGAQLTVLKLNYIPNGRKAPKQVVPNGISGDEAKQLIFIALADMDACTGECERRFGTKTKVADHPVLGPIPISGWRKFHLLHTLHHMKQVKLLAAASARRTRTASA